MPAAEQNYGPGAKWIKDLTKNRLGTFNGGHFSDVNLSSVLFTQRIDGAEHVKLQVWSAPGLTKPSFQEAMTKEFKPAKKGDSFGPSCELTNHWWKVTVKIPSDWEQYERVQFEFDPGCEAMIFATDGTPLQGITGGYGGDRRVEYILPHDARKKGTHDFVIESSCNGMFGVPWNGDTIAPPDMNRTFQLASADLVVPNQEAWGLMWDFDALREIVDALPGTSALQNRALAVANAMMNAFDRGDPASIGAARALAERVFGAGWAAKQERIYEEGPTDAQIWGIGHCHIDTAWLWPYSVTQQKVARSWSTQVDLMDRYPEHRFTCSSAQQYKWLEQLYPPLFARVKEKVRSGQFHPVGGSWVENDANMPSGEALARQMIFGQRFFESRFGKRCDTAWLPDSFGLTGALPQLIRLSGMDYFFTQKLSCNVFPHSTFNWVGIDGTQVLCHMTPVDTYTAQATVGDVQKGVRNHKNLESNSTALLVFGNGDGGGGPLAKMLENLRRIRGVANNSRELPPVVMGRSVDEFFEDAKRQSDGGSALPNWHGELYLEFHRGTYTSHGSIKKGNRKSEILMRDVEHLATLASVYKREQYSYPKEKIDNNWEKLLLNQCIGMVYDDAEKLYAEIRKDGEALFDEALHALFPSFVPLTAQIPAGSTLVGLNTTFLPRRDIVKVPLEGSGKDLQASVLQTSRDGKVGYVLMSSVEGADVARAVTSAENVDAPRVHVSGEGGFVLKNSSVQLTVAGGRITSLLDVRLGRELIAKGKTGGLIIFEDRPNYWDAWDVEIHHLEKWQELKFSDAKVVAEGPLRASVSTQVKYKKSTINVTISLGAISATLKPNSRPYFVFDAEVDWFERHEFLKFELPLDIHSDVATYETPFGHVQRPTHKNTTWDAAKFEVCGHKYADLSEFGYGVAILSESKYGFSCQGDVLRISLLRAATAPDAEQDQGKHEFSWAVLPHQGHFLESDVPIAGFLFNSPLHVRAIPAGSEDAAPPPRPLALAGAHNVILETLKRGDLDSDAAGRRTVVLRLYEAYGGHARADLRVAGTLPVVAAYATNLLEDDAGAEPLEFVRAPGDNAAADYVVPLEFRGFEVKTVKLVLARQG
ncbi:glycoside hydrolase family 38 protein [Heterobasidion irregulare TC 32-1]|uniref:Alpha-mannosidase n=1 Tax=Heterobasidion irregulare (strain TC 32-1) TaxID=747525 RepID=W4K1B3_HETIT|nr:glycoside hydrolase family 38 protein [Heterobasidion irregulare TC 32-1]ETW79602.1 glycoside hydrolase family 38 protein [Heterobasidion irregulare TC 32-1]